MGSQLRKKSLSLENDLFKNSCRFSFEMAAYTLEQGAEVSFGKDIYFNQAPFRTVSINSFYLRGTEIEKIKKIDGQNTIFIERLAISGLNAPLPTPYGELILRRKREQDVAMSEFVNVFNSRLLGVSYQISKRRYLNLQDHKHGNCMFVRSLAAICGEDFKNMNRRLSRIAYVLWTREKNASALESIITAMFCFKTKVDQFQTKWTPISANNRLTSGKMRLGVDSEIGTGAYVSNLNIKINLTHSSYDKIYNLLYPEKDNNEHLYQSEFDQMKYVIRKYIGDFYDCCLSIEPQNVPDLYLSEKKSKYKPRLGLTTWLSGKNCKKFDPVKKILDRNTVPMINLDGKRKIEIKRNGKIVKLMPAITA